VDEGKGVSVPKMGERQGNKFGQKRDLRLLRAHGDEERREGEQREGNKKETTTVKKGPHTSADAKSIRGLW